MRKFFKIVSWFVLAASLFVAVSAQSKSARSRSDKKPAATKTDTVQSPAPTAAPAPALPIDGRVKRNTRPVDGPASARGKIAATPVYLYEMSRPGFVYERIMIEHDEEGLGQISFLKSGFEDLMTDPLELSAPTLAKIKTTLQAMDFLNSAESYQYSKDYSHLGNITYTVKSGGRERTTRFNWTDHKHAKALMDEYRRISNEYTWRFEILMARENQPLQTPGLIELIDGYLGRGEISDPPHLLPFLRQLSTDERLPLMARNRADKIIKQIEKAMK